MLACLDGTHTTCFAKFCLDTSLQKKQRRPTWPYCIQYALLHVRRHASEFFCVLLDLSAQCSCTTISTRLSAFRTYYCHCFARRRQATTEVQCLDYFGIGHSIDCFGEDFAWPPVGCEIFELRLIERPHFRRMDCCRLASEVIPCREMRSSSSS